MELLLLLGELMKLGDHEGVHLVHRFFVMLHGAHTIQIRELLLSICMVGLVEHVEDVPATRIARGVVEVGFEKLILEVVNLLLVFRGAEGVEIGGHSDDGAWRRGLVSAWEIL